MAAPRPTSGIAKLLPALTLVVVFAYGLAAYLLLLKPLIAGVLGVRMAAIAAESAVTDLGAALSRADSAAREYNAINVELKEKVRSMVPAEVDMPGILVQIDAIAASSGLVLVSVDVTVDEKAVIEPGMRAVKVAMNLAGGPYGSLKGFLRDIERSVRLFDVDSVTFSPENASYGVTMTGYALADRE